MASGLLDSLSSCFSTGRAPVRKHDLHVDTAPRSRPALGVASKARHLEVLRFAWRRWHPRPRPLGRGGRVVHEFLARLLRWRPGPRGHIGVDGHFRLWRAGTSRRELHPDYCRVGGRHERHGGRDPGHDMAGFAAAADVATHPLHALHRHVRRGRRHALHADSRRPLAAHVPVGTCRRQYPARADRSGVAQAVGHAPVRRHGAGHRRWHRRSEDGVSRRDRSFHFDVRRRHDRRCAHRHRGDRRRAGQLGDDSLLRVHRLA